MIDLKHIWLVALVAIIHGCGIHVTNQDIVYSNGALVVEYGDSIAFKLRSRKLVIDSVYDASTMKTEAVGKQSYACPTDVYQESINQLSLVFYLSNGRIKKLDKHYIIVSDVSPEVLKIKEYSIMDHDTSLFTQGLVYDSGYLYESAGLYEHSSINKIDASNGKIIRQSRLDSMYFAEGLCLFNDDLHMLTWKEGQLFHFTKELEFISGQSYLHEGWGLTNTDSLFICSDGTSKLRFISPDALKLIKQLRVIDNNGEVRYINEMEFINNQIWANELGKAHVLIIEAETGRVLKKLDFSDIIKEHDLASFGSFNGIAFNKLTNQVYLTGKKWPYYLVCDLSNFQTESQ